MSAGRGFFLFMNPTYSAIHNGFPKNILATANGDDHSDMCYQNRDIWMSFTLRRTKKCLLFSTTVP